MAVHGVGQAGNQARRRVPGHHEIAASRTPTRPGAGIFLITQPRPTVHRQTPERSGSDDPGPLRHRRWAPSPDHGQGPSPPAGSGSDEAALRNEGLDRETGLYPCGTEDQPGPECGFLAERDRRVQPGGQVGELRKGPTALAVEQSTPCSGRPEVFFRFLLREGPGGQGERAVERILPATRTRQETEPSVSAVEANRQALFSRLDRSRPRVGGLQTRADSHGESVKDLDPRPGNPPLRCPMKPVRIKEKRLRVRWANRATLCGVSAWVLAVTLLRHPVLFRGE